jgi:hypothetical protein
LEYIVIREWYVKIPVVANGHKSSVTGLPIKGNLLDEDVICSVQ